MSDSVYKIIELIGTSDSSWEEAAARAVARATQSLRDLRIAEVVEQDLQIEDGKIVSYRTKVKLSFKYEGTN
jgi:dodecin